MGFGVVGTGVYEIITNGRAQELHDIEVKKIISLVVNEGFEHLITNDIHEIVDDEEIGIVVEAMGGLHPAFEYVMAALNAKKHVVTSNKHLVSAYFVELTKAAEDNGVSFRYTSSAGGGIPWLSTLRRARRSDEIEKIWGIVNGTTNYILDLMDKEGADFDAVLKEAQALGFAESDPSADIDGLDTQRKCIISANLAFDVILSPEDVPAYGIRNITHKDVCYFSYHSLVCKLFANAELHDGAVSAYVEPVLLPRHELESGVPSNYNCITYIGKYVGRSCYFGQGAGQLPTGNSVVQDILDIMQEKPAAYPKEHRKVKVNNDRIRYKYYVRTSNLTGALRDIVAFDEGDDVYITESVSLPHMHTVIEEICKNDPQCFFAQIRGEGVPC